MHWTERLFKLKENGSTINREVYSGLVSFLAVSYILAVNPAILGETGMNQPGVLCATALAGFVGTMLMALMANYPLVLAPAMGLNAFFTYTVVKTMGYSWQFALFAVVIEGIVFFLLSVSSIREKIITVIPMPLKYAMGAGIGMFITLIAFKSAHITQDHPETLLALQNFTKETFPTAGISAVLALFGVLVTAYLFCKKVPGSLLFGILITWIAGMICQAADVYHVTPEAGFYSLFPNFSKETFLAPLYGFRELFGSAFRTDEWFNSLSGKSGWQLFFSLDFIVVCLAFLFTDFFDTVGTINGAVVNTPLMEKDGTIPRIKGALLADSIATFAGGVFGTSTTTTFAESAAGINAGARTGLAAMTAAMLFLVSLVAAPIFMAIPGFATAPALIIVGFLMVKAGKNIDLEDISAAIPAYLLVVGTVFTYSVSDGLGLGIISWTLLNFRDKKRSNLLLWVLTLLFILKYVYL
ncbi:MAG: NCS2 family permease [Lentisphaeria bacterium]|nr:NCS2 family permease [Lentisphaeria bacterium]